MWGWARSKPFYFILFYSVFFLLLNHSYFSRIKPWSLFLFLISQALHYSLFYKSLLCWKTPPARCISRQRAKGGREGGRSTSIDLIETHVAKKPWGMNSLSIVWWTWVQFSLCFFGRRGLIELLLWAVALILSSDGWVRVWLRAPLGSCFFASWRHHLSVHITAWINPPPPQP